MITGLTATPTGTTSWLLGWSSDLAEPTFYVFRDGAPVGQTAQASMTVSVAPDASPVFEVFDDPDDEPTLGFPDFVLLTWGVVDGAVAYRVEQYVGGDWAEQRTLSAADGAASLTWRSGRLADGETHAFRVIPVGGNGNDGDATAFAILLVRVPDVPDVSIAYDGDALGTVTIDQA